MKRPRIVRVTWVDSGTHGEWTGGELAPVRCLSAGYLVRKTKSTIVVAAALSPDDGRYGAAIVIPRTAIRRLRRLR